MSLPEHTKCTYLVDNHETKVAELVYWVRTIKRTAVFLLFAIFVNFVLMYNLIRHPCSPSPSRGEPYHGHECPTHVGLVYVTRGHWMAAQGMAWWNMKAACEDFSDASNKINCVWGAVSTSITAAVVFLGGGI